jgi:hypothetical protein
MDRTEIVTLYVSLGLKVLSARLALLLTLLLTFALFAYSMYAPDLLRLATASAFALLVWLPVTRIDVALKKEREVLMPNKE